MSYKAIYKPTFRYLSLFESKTYSVNRDSKTDRGFCRKLELLYKLLISIEINSQLDKLIPLKHSSNKGLSAYRQGST